MRAALHQIATATLEHGDTFLDGEHCDAYYSGDVDELMDIARAAQKGGGGGSMTQTSTDPAYVPDTTTTDNMSPAERMCPVQVEAFRIANADEVTELAPLLKVEREARIVVREYQSEQMAVRLHPKWRLERALEFLDTWRKERAP
jgi:hypothetical protein